MTAKKAAAKKPPVEQPDPANTPGPAPTLTQGIDELREQSSEVTPEPKRKG